ncbi:MAG: aminopeptidase P family N-terminal domain-containing protein, partial [Lachnospiraceae bacterium]|nr:aminopeptidase P family N-terminal domain-containing protein [Lachnospiraceae bacterium]
MGSVEKQRIAELRKLLKEAGVDYYIVPTADYHNSEYVNDYFKMREFLSGFTGSAGTLVVGSKEAGLWTDGRYFVQAESELEGSDIVLYKMAEKNVSSIEGYMQKRVKEDLAG